MRSRVHPKYKTKYRVRRGDLTIWFSPGSTTRDRVIKRVKKIGRRRWKKESGDHRQARAENTFFRYKSIPGSRLRARHTRTQEAEAVMA